MEIDYAKDLIFPGDKELERVANIFDNELVKPITSIKYPEIAKKIDTLLEGNQGVWVLNDGITGNNHATIYTNAWYQDFRYIIPDLIMLFAELKECSPIGFNLYLHYFGKADTNEWERSRFTIKLEEYED